MRIALHTHFTNSWENLAALTIPNSQRYCDKHGYDFHVEKYADGNVDFVKTKTAYDLLYIYNYDVILCLECDILITNHTVRIKDFLDEDYSFLICKDINGVNFGSCIVSNTKQGIDFLHLINSLESKYKTEQNVLEDFERTKSFENIIKYMEHPSINSIPYKYYHNYGYINYNGQPEPTHEQGDWMPNDFICHLPGKPLQERIEIFNELKQHIIYE